MHAAAAGDNYISGFSPESTAIDNYTWQVFWLICLLSLPSRLALWRNSGMQLLKSSPKISGQNYSYGDSAGLSRGFPFNRKSDVLYIGVKRMTMADQISLRLPVFVANAPILHYYSKPNETQKCRLCATSSK